tara:strand:- start:4868 stop:6073 length:1206 start_codon:yes stop_codon:yes gene_type:complete
LKIHIEHLTLRNFRNYSTLELDLPIGIVLIEGSNGQGKSNLLEAIYMMAIAKSPRAKHEVELVNWDLFEELSHVQVAIDINSENIFEHLQLDLQCRTNTRKNLDSQDSFASTIKKNIKINDVQKSPTQLVGHLNAVLFTADDLDLVFGSPSVRRKYIDVLIARIDSQYLTSLQKYQNIVRNRNALLKTIKFDKDRVAELDFWDKNLSTYAGYIIQKRQEVISDLSTIANTIYSDLSIEEDSSLFLNYRCTVPISLNDDNQIDGYDIEVLKALKNKHEADIFQTVTSIGPHRDDIHVLLNNADAGKYSSRGQVRSMILALKMAEAMYLSQIRGTSPVLLLDDMLSELDGIKRRLIFEKISEYTQCIVTTAEIEIVPKDFLQEIQHLRLESGAISLISPNPKT